MVRQRRSDGLRTSKQTLHFDTTCDRVNLAGFRDNQKHLARGLDRPALGFKKPLLPASVANRAGLCGCSLKKTTPFQRSGSTSPARYQSAIPDESLPILSSACLKHSNNTEESEITHSANPKSLPSLLNHTGHRIKLHLRQAFKHLSNIPSFNSGDDAGCGNGITIDIDDTHSMARMKSGSTCCEFHASAMRIAMLRAALKPIEGKCVRLAEAEHDEFLGALKHRLDRRRHARPANIHVLVNQPTQPGIALYDEYVRASTLR